jgi:hypothetical protein
VEPIITESARRHGWADEDILHAYRQPIRVWPNADDDMDMIIGPTGQPQKCLSLASLSPATALR